MCFNKYYYFLKKKKNIYIYIYRDVYPTSVMCIRVQFL